ncbi:hypothetical protein ACT17_32945 [Mycolicibacterium conceptionense]|jgi:hypothetical protein|uniref:Uncharacterized protein n=1 Tax=Mycolicibacterium conceptionense TaxID=451644 RepID=A0A0J8WLI2_9MYCO|nr:hypothetical protein [Mycolicibacterium conceptionense]KMV13869.1 hypothetical protein ACT17_32945 [Mycolicibacterium conceptionense]
MSVTARLDVGTYVELGEGVAVTQGLEDALCCVVRADGDVRDVRRVNQSTGLPEGPEARFLAAELRPARPVAVQRCSARRVR